MFTNKHLPRFNKGCCCCSLRTSNIVLVYVNLLLSLAMCTMYIVLDFYKFIIRIFTADWDNWMHRMIRYKTVPLVLAALIVVYGIAEICMSVVALIGLHKKRYGIILKYMYYTIFVTIMLALSRIFDMENHSVYFEIGPDLLYYAFKVYYMLSIRSQIKSIEELKAVVTYTPDAELNSNESTTNGAEANNQNVDSVKIITNCVTYVDIKK